jgi:hypothetical protein
MCDKASIRKCEPLDYYLNYLEREYERGEMRLDGQQPDVYAILPRQDFRIA